MSKKALKKPKTDDKDVAEQLQRRRRVLSTLTLGMVGAYVAPTLFSMGEAQAQWRGSYSRPAYSRYSYSYSYSYDNRRRSRRRSRIRDYTEDPLLILEDAIIGSQKR